MNHCNLVYYLGVQCRGGGKRILKTHHTEKIIFPTAKAGGERLEELLEDINICEDVLSSHLLFLSGKQTLNRMGLG